MSVSLVYHSSTSASGGESPFDATIVNILQGTEALITCPYIGLTYLRSRISRCAGWRLITDFEELLSSTRADSREELIAFAADHEGQIHHMANLHAKVVIAGNSALVGSANLTSKGVLHREEVSVLFTDCPQVEELRNWFSATWSRSATVNDHDLRRFIAQFPEGHESFVPDRVLRSGSAINASLAVQLPEQQVAAETTGAPASSVAKAARTPFPKDVEDVLKAWSKQTDNSLAFAALVESLLDALSAPDANVRTTGSNPARDIRFGLPTGLFAEFWLTKRPMGLQLKLYLPHESIVDLELHWLPGKPDKDKCQTFLPVGRPISDKQMAWISRSKNFVWGK